MKRTVQYLQPDALIQEQLRPDALADPDRYVCERSAAIWSMI